MLARVDAPATAYAPPTPAADGTLSLVRTLCCLCDADEADPIAVGEDFDHRTSGDTFLATRCRACGLLFVNPQPAPHELARLYPEPYDEGVATSPGQRRDDAERLLGWCGAVPARARVLDVGCGAGRHLGLLRDFGRRGWLLEGVEPRGRAVARARAAGHTVHEAFVEELAARAPDGYDAALLLHTLEQLADPPAALAAVRALVRPGGQVLIVTHNAASRAWATFQGRHWAGYDFPRHRYLFDRDSLAKLAARVGLQVESARTAASTDVWVHSARNAAADWGAPAWAAARLTPVSPLPRAVLAVVEHRAQRRGQGAILCATLRAPA